MVFITTSLILHPPPFQCTLLTESHQTRIKREGRASRNLAIALNSQLCREILALTSKFDTLLCITNRHEVLDCQFIYFSKTPTYLKTYDGNPITLLNATTAFCPASFPRSCAGIIACAHNSLAAAFDPHRCLSELQIKTVITLG